MKTNDPTLKTINKYHKMSNPQLFRKLGKFIEKKNGFLSLR